MDEDDKSEPHSQSAEKTRQFFEEMVKGIKSLGATKVTFISKSELDALSADEIRQRSPVWRRMWIRSRNSGQK